MKIEKTKNKILKSKPTLKSLRSSRSKQASDSGLHGAAAAEAIAPPLAGTAAARGQ